ncbi:MAG TPA: BON domain-containing protein [Longimicrobiales bacterium]|nr:BON domain-containing protein [Longimicrobiales bacterium]
MAKDFEDLYYLESMGDDEIRDLVIQQLGEDSGIDVDSIEVTVDNGAVRLSGRVGNDREIQRIESVLTDVIGIEQVRNELVHDELVRSEDDGMTASPRNATSDEAEHLMNNVEVDQFGTDNPSLATERGTSYEPGD